MVTYLYTEKQKVDRNLIKLNSESKFQKKPVRLVLPRGRQACNVLSDCIPFPHFITIQVSKLLLIFYFLLVSFSPYFLSIFSVIPSR
jgi:hypothetical protein